jgi:colanic acid/amylovoran biosynthesis glycosyltransferase
VTFHGSDATVTDLRYQKTTLGFQRYVANKGTLKSSGALFLAVSDFLRRKLLDQGFPEQRVLVHYTGVDTAKFQPAGTEAGPVILFVGRLEESKGAEFLIKAAADVQKQLPEAEVVVIGEGSLRPGLELLARQSLRRFRFLGSRTPREVCDWMNRSSVVCVPSISRRSGEEEGFGMVCAEAHAVGKPVVAFDSGGIPEIVLHAQTGFLAEEGNWRSMAGYLSLLLQDAKLRERFGQVGRELVLRQFSLQHRNRILEEIYARVSGCEAALKEEQNDPIVPASPARSSPLTAAV